MNEIQNFSQDIVGVKRQLPCSFNSTKHEDIIKKTKLENLLQIKEPQPIRNSSEPYIPPLILEKPKVQNVGLEYLKSLLLLNQSVMAQRFLNMLTLSQYVQQKPLLTLSRENSISSSSSISSCDTSSPVRVPILLPKLANKPKADAQEFEGSFLHKKSKVSACKNYIALLCTGFARSILTASSGSEILNHLCKTMSQKRSNYVSLQDKKDQELKDYIMDHLYKDICGKRVKKINKGRDFKVRNTEELELLLILKDEDADLVKFRKEVVKEMIDYFFMSKYYFEWLENGMINTPNKDFFLKNKLEIQKKFSNPTLYKPHFDYNSH